MGRGLIWGLFGCILVAVSTCTSRTPAVISTPDPTLPSRIALLPPPTAAVDIPVPDMEWTPVSYGAGSGEALAAQLTAIKSIALILPKKGNPVELENRVFQMVKAAAPNTEIVARGKAEWDDFVAMQGRMPQRLSAVSEEPDGTTYHLPKDHPLSKKWLARKRILKGAEGLLVVRPIQLSDEYLKELRNEKTGGCDEMEKLLRDGIQQAQKGMADFERRVTEILGKEFSRYLASALPFWRGELLEIAAITDPDSLMMRCRDAYDKMLDQFEPCIKKRCSRSPRLFIEGGGIVGMPDPAPSIPDVCPALGMRNYASEIVDLADRAVVEVLPALDGAWAAELVRFGGLEQGTKYIFDTCAPRHRRVNDTDLVAARKAVVSYFEALKQTRFTAMWKSVGGMEHVAGAGPVKVFARAKQSVGDAGGDATRLQAALKKMSRCSTQGEQVYQASIIDVFSANVVYMGLFFEENLLCDEMPPQ